MRTEVATRKDAKHSWPPEVVAVPHLHPHTGERLALFVGPPPRQPGRQVKSKITPPFLTGVNHVLLAVFLGARLHAKSQFGSPGQSITIRQGENLKGSFCRLRVSRRHT